jgi:uncharacterized lipoprotein YajG
MKSALLGTVLSLWLAGCALTNEHINLAYAPLPGVSAIPGANRVMVSVQVDDGRFAKGPLVGFKKNGYGEERGGIFANDEVPVTLRRAIEQELQSRGFAISRDATVSIVAEVTRFWNDHQQGVFSGSAVADLHMSVTVKNKDGHLLCFRQVAVQGVESGTQLANGENARLALNKAMENGMKSLFEDQEFLAALLRS